MSLVFYLVGIRVEDLRIVIVQWINHQNYKSSQLKTTFNKHLKTIIMNFKLIIQSCNSTLYIATSSYLKIIATAESAQLAFVVCGSNFNVTIYYYFETAILGS